MEIVESLIKFLHIIVSIILILAVLLQPGKSGDLGSMFGGGSSESVFGSSGAVPFLSKLTRVLAVVFFSTSLSLGYFAIRGSSSSVLQGEIAPTAEFEPAEVVTNEDAAINPTTGSIDNPATSEDAAKPEETIKSEEDSGETPPEDAN
ncbi:MAG: preprotein translocase subunit SecG [Deltaproteobacteria bacterium]|nr:MAG: preprotein translocase subunit SecG [Deltaproteobacteria bacterium]